MKISITTDDGVLIGSVYESGSEVWVDTLIADDEIVSESDRDFFGSPVLNGFAEIVEQARRIEKRLT